MEERLIYRIEINTSILPEVFQKILNILIEEKNLAIKGGLARAIFLILAFEIEKKPISSFRLKIEENLKDLDLIIFHYFRLAESKEYLLRREATLKTNLSSVLQENNIRFDGRDIEPIKGTIMDQDCKKKLIYKILTTRDLTINEIILIPECGRWYAYCTQQGWRDLIGGIGVLSPNGWKTVRRDKGRMVPTNYGLFRLFRFFVEGKVRKIWLPQWMINIHLTEMKRLQEEGKLPEGATLGRYSRILTSQFRDADEEIKLRWMQLLNSLGFTDLASFDDYAKEQELLDGLNNEFDFEDQVLLETIIEKTLVERKEKQESKHLRNQQMEKCEEHLFEEIYCENCQSVTGCKIKKCVLCNRVEASELLFCNKIFQESDWTKEENALINFPKYYELKCGTQIAMQTMPIIVKNK